MSLYNGKCFSVNPLQRLEVNCDYPDGSNLKKGQIVHATGYFSDCLEGFCLTVVNESGAFFSIDERNLDFAEEKIERTKGVSVSDLQALRYAGFSAADIVELRKAGLL